MNIIRRAAARVIARGPAVAVDVQAGPVTWRAGGDRGAITTKVDHAIRIGSAILVCGWSTAPGEMRLASGGKGLKTRQFRTSRPDVARYLGRVEADGLGYVLFSRVEEQAPVTLQCLAADGDQAASYSLRISSDSVSANARSQLAPVLALLRESGELDAAALSRIDKADAGADTVAAFASGALDDLRGSQDTQAAVASGWLVRQPGVEAWLEDGQGRRFPLDAACWTPREDVPAVLQPRLSAFAATPGFLLRLDGVVPGERVRLMVSQDEHAVALAELVCVDWGADPNAASRWLFTYSTPMARLAERVAHLDLPVIEGLIRARQRDWPALPVQVQEVGAMPPAPRVSIVIPLHGRLDFVEHQLIEFARDPWLLANAEVVYVVDDQALVDRMAADAWTLQRLYRVPFRWVWGGVNRGFSGANNLGTAHSRGEYLVFLNSDAFPRGPGWLQTLVGTLEADTGLGAVGPRLLFADGSIQHAGMAFRRREDLGIWTNHHPGMGLDPALDPHRSLADVPCVTGACLAMRRSDLEGVGGWDTGYLIGDFEDSDLCLKLRAAGKRIGYLPLVELTHLERQSFKLLGEGDYRTRVVIYNAVRHQQRWREEIEATLGPQESVQ